MARRAAAVGGSKAAVLRGDGCKRTLTLGTWVVQWVLTGSGLLNDNKPEEEDEK